MALRGGGCVQRRAVATWGCCRTQRRAAFGLSTQWGGLRRGGDGGLRSRHALHWAVAGFGLHAHVTGVRVCAGVVRVGGYLTILFFWGARWRRLVPLPTLRPDCRLHPQPQAQAGTSHRGICIVYGSHVSQWCARLAGSGLGG